MTDSSKRHPLNKPSEMVDISPGNVTDFSPIQSLNAHCPIDVMSSWKFIVSKLEHPSKRYVGRALVSLGIAISFKESQLLKAYDPIDETVSGIVTVFKDAQFWKSLAGMADTLSGITNVSSPEPLKEASPILVIPAGRESVFKEEQPYKKPVGREVILVGNCIDSNDSQFSKT